MFGGNMAKMMQQAQQVKQNMDTAKEQIRNLEVQMSSGNELTLTMNGQHQITHLSLSDTALTDKALLEDMLTMTINNASQEINSQTEALMKEATGGINLPF